MRYWSVVIFCLLCLWCIDTQGQSTFFNKTYDIEQWDGATAALPLDDGYMVLGQAVTTQARMIMLIKLNFSGDTVWSKVFEPPPQVYYTGVGSSFIKTSDGGYAFCGTAVDSANSSLDDLVLVKFDSLGDTLWTKRYGGTGQDQGQDCKQTSDNGFILIGSTVSFGDGSGEIYLIKTDSLGNIEWDTTYGFSGSFEAAHSVNTTDDGGYILGGYSTQNGNRIWTLKIDYNGDTLWTTKINVNGTVSGLVIQCLDGGYIVSSSKDQLTGNGKDGYIAKLDSSGNILWERIYVGSGQDDWLSQAVELPDGSIVAAGQSRNSNNISSGWLLKVAPNGDSLWSRKFSVPDSLSQQFWSLRATQDGGFIMSGNALAPGQDTWVVKTNCLGYDEPPQANFGVSSDTLTAIFTNTSERSATYLWDFGDGNFNTDINPTHIYQDSGTYVVTLVAAACGDTSIFSDTVAVSIPVGMHPQLSDREVGLFLAPNPFKESTTITYQLPFNTEYGKIAIYNTVGHVVDSYKVIGSGQVEFYSSHLSPGIYVCNYIHGNKVIKSLRMVIIK